MCKNICSHVTVTIAMTSRCIPWWSDMQRTVCLHDLVLATCIGRASASLEISYPCVYMCCLLLLLHMSSQAHMRHFEPCTYSAAIASLLIEVMVQGYVPAASDRAGAAAFGRLQDRRSGEHP